ncbi:hypothetical protein AVEN_265479-1 [Araneus ventricosus]|uniref:Uncharacterized protein n=1 Tax=Araneus ventricosus TaxID=182803 RepID=A0A4Y2CGA6_ARAVE|nr:hypothetical protein AVEN_265479-1 [Araneus ventricosus]
MHSKSRKILRHPRESHLRSGSLRQDGCEAGGLQLNPKNTEAAIRIVIASLYRTAVASRSRLKRKEGDRNKKRKKEGRREKAGKKIADKIKEKKHEAGVSSKNR